MGVLNHNAAVINNRGPNVVKALGFKPRFPRWLLPVADDGSTKGVRTTLPVVNQRGRSGSAPFQVDLAIKSPASDLFAL